MQVVVDALLTQYSLSGKGKLVVLLHGWGDSSKGLSQLASGLSKSYQVLAVDLPGFGGSQVPAAAWNLDNYAHFVAAVLAKLELDQPYAVIGHSNGGAVAIRGAGLGVLHPQKLVLLAASGVRLKQTGRKLALKAVAKTGKVATAWLPQSKKQALRKKLYAAAGSDMLVVPQLEETFKKTVSQDVQIDASKISVPTLLIFAEDDQAVPLAYGQRYHQLIKGSELKVVPSAGHFVHLDQPQIVTRAIEEFLA
ncbi:MAG TPA: alpha/beta hydrolase [Candidatus Saccharimonadales bacterium]|nr:alpha/beta hydrolase [Candidatus Saccharimonadales bacterium]